MNRYRSTGILAALLAGASALSAQTLPSFCSSYPQAVGPGQWQSSVVFYDGGRLAYVTDAEGNRVPDYSYAGYKYGQVPIPHVPTAMQLNPAPGDNTARIQRALDEIGARAPDANGLRGALLLGPGRYEIAGQLRVRSGGVVLRGSGDGDGRDANRDTVLLATGDTPHHRAVVVIGSGRLSWPETDAASITTPFVPVGSLSFDVASTAAFRVGDEIVVNHPSTQAWIDALGGGGPVGDARWRPGSADIVYFRRIAAISGTTVTLDAPVYNHLDRRLSQSHIAKVNGNSVSQVGVEDLRIDIVTAGPEDENHAWNGVYVQGAHDSWVRRVTALHFGYAGVRLENAVRVTVEQARALDPHGVRTGGNFYNFASDRRTQLTLFTRCLATGGRHSYISNGLSLTSGLVYHRCVQHGGGSEGGHRYWTTGTLYDNHDELPGGPGQVLFINRGDFGTSHGWGAAHSTVWKYDGESVVQKPPTAQNYGMLIEGQGHFRQRFYHPPPTRGVEEQRAGELIPTSLYEAQLCERLRR